MRAGRKSKAAPKKDDEAQGKPKASSKLREAAERNISRAKALEALYRPFQEAARAELQKTESGRALLEEANAFAKELGELSKGTASGKATRAKGGLRARDRVKKFREQYGDQLHAAYAKQAHLQPSVAAVAQILRPEMTAQTTWVSETSILGSMLLRPKVLPQDVGTVTQGLGGDPPPLVQSCVTAPYGQQETNLINADISYESPVTFAMGLTETGDIGAGGNAATDPFDTVGVLIASGFVGQDFPVPPGPTSYTTTISYNWQCWGFGFAIFGITIVNVDLAIAIDKRDGTRETFAREISLLTTPVISGDSFHHEADDVTVTIPFQRDGSNGTVRIMVGADAQTTVVSPGGYGEFFIEANVRKICLTSVG